jgi:hypothetical protein
MAGEVVRLTTGTALWKSVTQRVTALWKYMIQKVTALFARFRSAKRQVHVPERLPPVSQTELDRMAKGFFGYGRWDAPFWFIGAEPGMTQGGGSLLLKYVVLN